MEPHSSLRRHHIKERFVFACKQEKNAFLCAFFLLLLNPTGDVGRREKKMLLLVFVALYAQFASAQCPSGVVSGGFCRPVTPSAFWSFKVRWHCVLVMCCVGFLCVLRGKGTKKKKRGIAEKAGSLFLSSAKHAFPFPFCAHFFLLLPFFCS